MPSNDNPRLSSGHFVADLDETPIKAVDAVDESEKPRSSWNDAWDSMKTRPLFWISAALIVLVIVVALAPGLFTSVVPTAADLSKSNQGSQSGHIMGFTRQGTDVFSRVVWGTQTALSVVVIAVVLSLFAGVLLGVVSGYLGGWLDRILVVIADAIYPFPTLLLAIVVSIVLNGGQSSLWGGILSAAVSITVVYIPQYFRVIRAEVVRLKAEAFVESAKVIGTSTPRITVLIRSAKPFSTSSPTSWPKVSLTDLKWSMSRIISAKGLSPSAAVSMRPPRCDSR